MKFSKIAIALASAVFCFSAYASNNNPTTFVGPTVRLGFTNTISDTSAYSLIGEVGAKNFRAGGTLGLKIADDQWLKFSGDYLWQGIKYSFFSGETQQWMQQWSVGTAYEYDLVGYNFAPQLNISAYYAHTPSKTLNDRVGSFINNFGVLTNYTDQRRIAGSSAGGAAPGVSAALWDGGRVGLELNYDDVAYDQVNTTSNQDAKGFGGTVRIKQMLGDNMDLNVAAGIRKPFNLYSANLGWNNVQFYGDWRLGVFGDYVAGKNTLPNTWNLGLSADYLLDSRCPVSVRNLKGDLKGEHMVPITDNLLAWTADPAVYLPQVLAIPDGKTPGLTSICAAGSAPTLLSAIPSDIVFNGTMNIASHFSGTGLTFAIASVTPALSVGEALGINAVGILNWSLTSEHTVTIRATNSCGTVVSNAFIVGEDIT